MKKNFYSNTLTAILLTSFLVSCIPSNPLKTSQNPISNGGSGESNKILLSSDLHGDWEEEGCLFGSYVPSSTHYKIFVSLTKDKAVVTRKNYQGGSCAQESFLGDLIYEYEVSYKSENTYNTVWKNASFIPSGLNLSTFNDPNSPFCGFTSWSESTEVSIMDKTCLISGSLLNFNLQKDFPDTINFNIGENNKLNTNFDQPGLKFSKAQ